MGHWKRDGKVKHCGATLGKLLVATGILSIQKHIIDVHTLSHLSPPVGPTMSLLSEGVEQFIHTKIEMHRSGLPKVIQIINGKDNAGLCFWTETVPGVWGFFPPLPPPVMKD